MSRFTGSDELTAATPFSVRKEEEEFSVRKINIIYIAASVPAATFSLPPCRPVERTAKRTEEFLPDQELRNSFETSFFILPILVFSWFSLACS